MTVPDDTPMLNFFANHGRFRGNVSNIAQIGNQCSMIDGGGSKAPMQLNTNNFDIIEYAFSNRYRTLDHPPQLCVPFLGSHVDFFYDRYGQFIHTTMET